MCPLCFFSLLGIAGGKVSVAIGETKQGIQMPSISHDGE